MSKPFCFFLCRLFITWISQTAERPTVRSISEVGSKVMLEKWLRQFAYHSHSFTGSKTCKTWPQFSPSFQMEQHIRNLKRTSRRSTDDWPMSNSNSVNLTPWKVAPPYHIIPKKRPGNLLSHHCSAALPDWYAGKNDWQDGRPQVAIQR